MTSVRSRETERRDKKIVLPRTGRSGNPVTLPLRAELTADVLNADSILSIYCKSLFVNYFLKGVKKWNQSSTITPNF